MKKTILLLVVLSLLVPAAALAATEFSLGGFIKLDSFWDSTQEGKNMNTAILRNNDPNFQHGRLFFTAQGSRFNFTIKGPDLWGAKTSGFIEMDFDSSTDMGVAAGAISPANPPGGAVNTIGTVQSASNNYVPRMRHAMFRLNWAETELMFGQYWSMFCEFFPDTLQDGPFQGTGCATARVPQIRLTQKFLGDWTVAGLIGSANPAGVQENAYSLTNAGYNAEAPQVQAKLAFERDLWGKAAFFGRPRGFVAQATAGWQRLSLRPNTPANIAAQGTAAIPAATGLFTFTPFFGVTQNAAETGMNNIVVGGQHNHQNLNAWIVQGSLFIPVIPTYTANLAGTASLTAQWFVGRGLNAFGFVGDNGLFKYVGTTGVGGVATNMYDQELLCKFGGYLQGQYWFTNQWYANLAWGMSRVYSLPAQHDILGGAAVANGARVTSGDQYKLWNEIDATIYYRPIEAVKFGLQYSYGRTDWLYKTYNPVAAGRYTNVGEAHRIEFAAYLYF
jgi:hypothetical protein